MFAELLEQLIVRLELILPGCRVDARQLGILRWRKFFQPLPVQILEAGHGAERRLDAAPATLAALDDPLQHAHVFAEPRPDEFALGVAPEPVDAEDSRRVLDRATHLQPVL